MRISDWSSDVCSSDLISLLAIFGPQPADRRDRHQDRATDITGLPLHPVIVCGLNDRVALADRLVLMAPAVEQLAMLKLSRPKESMEMHMAELMGQGRA